MVQNKSFIICNLHYTPSVARTFDDGRDSGLYMYIGRHCGIYTYMGEILDCSPMLERFEPMRGCRIIEILIMYHTLFTMSYIVFERARKHAFVRVKHDSHQRLCVILVLTVLAFFVNPGRKEGGEAIPA